MTTPLPPGGLLDGGTLGEVVRDGVTDGEALAVRLGEPVAVTLGDGPVPPRGLSWVSRYDFPPNVRMKFDGVAIGSW